MIINETKNDDFKAVKLMVASPDHIMQWSRGEITKPETINYRTLKPEKDGLFCERIFGPSKDWECYCGKYKRIRYKGVVCDRCGVEVTRSIVRRERMGHIKLAVPVTHIWFLRGAPSSIGLTLNLSVRDLEKVVYFANFIVLEVDEEAKSSALKQIDEEFKVRKTEIANLTKDEKEATIQIEELEQYRNSAKEELAQLTPMEIISEQKYREFSMKYGEVFRAGIGAEAIQEVLSKINLEELAESLRNEVDNSQGVKRKKALKRSKLIEGFLNAKIKPDWMVMSVLPVIPPDLRPMVQLDGGRFATSDLNDLYRRVINRNNRLKRLLDMDAPEVICRNEKRMLQEAVDALIDNGARRDKNVATATSRRKLRSLADMLKGKQGRFRQNLLGKRVDYSGRSVIVVGPELELHQCGLPKMMALELFKPFVISKLIMGGLAHNVKSASRMIERSKNEVWDALDEVIQDKYVLLNRAPTLHRLGIQAFKPVLIEGKAIQIHPLVCAAFNADFDGDQMAVHVPLSAEAQREAKEIMLSSNNLLKPAAGEPVVKPSQDMVLGIYWMTTADQTDGAELKVYSDSTEAILAYDTRNIGIRKMIKVMINAELIETTVGRILFNNILPDELGFVNDALNKKKLTNLVDRVYKICGKEATVGFVDRIKDLGFRYSTKSGLSFSMEDIQIPVNKEEILKGFGDKEIHTHEQYNQGLITEDEKYGKTLEIWENAKKEVQKSMSEQMDRNSTAFIMMDSGARGEIGQLTQLAGMKGLVVSATGRIIELPIKSNYKEGLSSLEYFISTHGARKGLSDTALKTSDSGYLTRRLVDVSQDVIVTEKDCGTKETTLISITESKAIGEDFAARVKGRVLAENVVNSKTGEIIAKKGVLITDDVFEDIENGGIEEVYIRSISNCKAEWGVCQKCYGSDLAKGGLIELGEAVGIIAAQSIGEPGTQLTMRTFHAGGVAGADITQGLPRVEELFEARMPKGQAILTELSGVAHIETSNGKHKIEIVSQELNKDIYDATGYSIEVKNNQFVELRDILATKDGKKPVKAKNPGTVKIKDHEIQVVKEANIKLYEISSQVGLLIKDGDVVEIGQAITEGSWNLQEALKLLGENAVQRYIVKEVQQTYASEGQTINDKHIEIIIRQMFSRCRIDEANGTPFVVGEIVSRTALNRANNEAIRKGTKPAESTNLLLSISKVALTTDSFLSAASFQETSKVLISAAVAGKVDDLRGLKENVIIGKLIPAGTGFDETLTRSQ
ncbi:MAG: DNA-directed RNA polymerase subunit beta' [Patescibacteria group bacterium]